MDLGAHAFSYLAGVTARSLVLFGVAAAAMLLFRVREAAARHAVWTVVAGGMLTLAVLSPALPALELRVLKAAPAATTLQLAVTPIDLNAGSAAAPLPALPATRAIGWREIAAALYAAVALALLGRLAFGYLFTRRLLRAAAPISRFEDTYTSAWISVPMTVGRMILLPADWDSWGEPKLQAVLAHERTHVRRADWWIALLAGVNRCVYWFNPVAWWLERRLATLAEQACDDSALLLVESRPYAQALLDMAATVKTAQGRVVWEAMAMANKAEVSKRIERILDETRRIPRGLTRARWTALVACSVPVIWFATVAQLASQEMPKTPAAMADYLKGHRQLAPADVHMMEQYLTANPQDIDARAQLILYYYANGVREPRMSHILWLIANHPEASATVFASQGIVPRNSAMNSETEYGQARSLWRQAATARSTDAVVVGNAAQFFQAVGEFEDAERLLLEGAALQSGNLMWKDRLGRLYAAAILGATGDSHFVKGSSAFATQVQTKLATSDDGRLVFYTANTLLGVARRPDAGQTLPSGVLNLNDHPALVPAVEFGQQLLARAHQLGAVGTNVGNVILPGGPRGGVVGGVVGGVPGGVPGGTIGGVIGETQVRQGTLGGIISSVPSNGPPPPQPQLLPAPPVVKRIEPVYPPLARQARIQGVVKFRAIIGADGTVRHLEVMSGHPLLVPPAMEAVKEWTFQPPASEITVGIDVPFSLPAGEVPPLPEGVSRKGMRIRVGSNVQEARLLHKVDPIYPTQARAEGIEGSVTLSIVIDEDGKVTSADPVDGNPILAAAAQEAVRQWTYDRTLLNGQPVSVATTVVVPFSLR